MCELLEPLPKDEHDEWIEKVIEAVQKLPLSSTLISKEDIHKAAQVGRTGVIPINHIELTFRLVHCDENLT